MESPNESILDQFESPHDAVLHLEQLVEQAKHTRKHKEKQSLLKQAQEIADAYQSHCEAGGNFAKQFNQIYYE